MPKEITFFCLLMGLSIAGCSSGEDQFVYSGFTDRNLSLDGGARIMPSGLIELTDSMVRQKGHAFHPSPVLFHKSGTVQSFSISFVFAILSIYPESGHGLAFFMRQTKISQLHSQPNTWASSTTTPMVTQIVISLLLSLTLSKIMTYMTSMTTMLASISIVFDPCNPMKQAIMMIRVVFS